MLLDFDPCPLPEVPVTASATKNVTDETKLIDELTAHQPVERDLSCEYVLNDMLLKANELNV